MGTELTQLLFTVRALLLATHTQHPLAARSVLTGDPILSSGWNLGSWQPPLGLKWIPDNEEIMCQLSASLAQ